MLPMRSLLTYALPADRCITASTNLLHPPAHACPEAHLNFWSQMPLNCCSSKLIKPPWHFAFFAWTPAWWLPPCHKCSSYNCERIEGKIGTTRKLQMCPWDASPRAHAAQTVDKEINFTWTLSPWWKLLFMTLASCGKWAQNQGCCWISERVARFVGSETKIWLRRSLRAADEKSAGGMA